MDKKNVLIFLNAFWNSGKGMSGGDQMLIQIFKRIRNNFGTIFCYTNEDGKKVISRDVNDVSFRISRKFYDKLSVPVNYCFRTIGAASCLKLRNVDIIYCGSDFFPDVIPAFIFKLFRKKTKWFQCVFHIYPSWKTRPGNKFRNFSAQYLQKLCFRLIRKADVIININSQVGEELVGMGFDKNKIVINTPGIDVGYFNNLEITPGEKKYDATFLARLNPSKGIFDLVKIWEKVVEKIPEAKLAIIGGGSNETKNNLQKRIDKNNLSKNIDILGFLENDQSFSLIKNSKLFLFPSHEEGFGIAIAEAMASGVPAIAWDLSVYGEIFEDNLIKIKENEIDIFADKTTELINNDSLRLEIAKKAIIFIEKYDWGRIARKHLEILDLKI